ncbi:glycosyltransferase family 4 protein [Indioceanicola profundi]|uniref:glycosyltransferase family 4 protein n=1 Tax=Indioceanicola profundi TaxID=2220096 RepID=UPI000E6AA7CF|nr:glycosyltransferase family 4 protein [Indioceanicola profundi]
MRIVLVEPNGTGGLAHFAHQLCTALAAAGADVVLITSCNYELAQAPRNFQLEPCMRLWSIHEDRPPTAGLLGKALRRIRRVRRALRFARVWQELVARIRALEPDVAMFSIIHFPFQWIYLDQLRRAGIRMTQICHEFEARDSRRSVPADWLRVRMFRRVYGNFSAIMFLSQDTRSAFLAQYPEVRVSTPVMPHGTQDLFSADPDCIDRLRQSYGIGKADRVVLFFGTLRPSKGVPELIEAFAMLPDRTRTRLLIAGYPNKHMDTDELRRRIERLGLGGEVVLDLRYLPNEEIGSLISLGDVVAFPYRNATQSGVLYLAYAFSRPIVATQVGGLAEDLEDGVTGLGVPAGDTAALSAAIARLLDDRELAARLGAAGHDKARARNSWSQIARTVLDIHAPLVGRGHP